MSETSPTAVDTTPTPPETLEPGVSRQRTLEAETVHRYEVEVAEGHVLDVTVEQEGADVRLALLAPGDRELVWMDGPTSGQGTETAALVAPAAGVYGIDVRAGSASGGYVIHLAPLRPATEADRQRGEGLAVLARSRARLKEADGMTGDAADGARREGREGLRDAQQRLLEAGARREAGLALYYLGFSLVKDGAAPAAIETFAQALELLEGQADLSAARLAMAQRRGALLLEVGDPAAAREAADRLWEMALAAESGVFLRGALELRGDVFLQEGERFAALDAFREAGEVARATGDAEDSTAELTSLLRRGVALDEVGETDEAIPVLRRALDAARASRLRKFEAATLVNLGNAHVSRGRQARDERGEGAAAARRHFEEARRLLEVGLALHRELGQDRWIASALSSLGTVHLELGDPEAAAEPFREALEVARRNGFRREAASAVHKLGRQRFQSGRPQEALELHQEAAAEFAALGDRQGTVTARYGAARCLHALGRHGEARYLLEAVLGDAEELREATARPDLQASWVSARAHYWELYVDTLMHLHDEAPTLGHDLLALAAAERWRARNLLDQLQLTAADVRRGADPTLVAQEGQVQRQLGDVEGELERERRGERIAELEERRRILLSDLNHVREEIRRTSSTLARLDPDPGRGTGDPLAVTAIQRHELGSGDLVLVYSLGEERSFLWAVTRNEMATSTLPARQEIDALAEAVLEGLQSRRSADGAEGHRRVQALSEVVLGPVADRLRGEHGDSGSLLFPRLVVVGDGSLQSVPFAALPLPGGKGEESAGERLLHRREVVHLPSLQALPSLRSLHRERKPAPRALAVLADPVFQADDPRLRGGDDDPVPARERSAGLDQLLRLPATRQEAQTILAQVPQENRKAALGFAANRDVVLSGELAQYRILHFATHGLADRRHPELSGLAFSAFHPDGRRREAFLWVHEIHDLDLPAELVVLSACETGLGRSYRGEGMVGLARGFMSAGTPRLVVSLWKVDDEATAMLMYLFYENLLKKRMPPAAALRVAQRSLSEDARWNHPYYWAGFAFVGDWTTEASLANPDDPIEEPETGTVNDPPPPRTPDGLPLPEVPEIVEATAAGNGGTAP